MHSLGGLGNARVFQLQKLRDCVSCARAAFGVQYGHVDGKHVLGADAVGDALLLTCVRLIRILGCDDVRVDEMLEQRQAGVRPKPHQSIDRVHSALMHFDNKAKHQVEQSRAVFQLGWLCQALAVSLSELLNFTALDLDQKRRDRLEFAIAPKVIKLGCKPVNHSDSAKPRSTHRLLETFRAVSKPSRLDYSSLSI